MSNPVAHSVLGASSAGRWMNCPASVALSAGIEDKPSVYAAEGTAAHGLAEQCLKRHEETAAGYEGVKLAEFVGDKATKALLGDRVVTAEMVEAVNVYLDHVNETYASLSSGALFVERRIDLTQIMPNLPDDVRPFGTCDCILLDTESRRLFVYDFKYGAGVAVGAENNAQLRYYGVGAMLAFGGYDLDTVTVSIIQPRSPKGPYVKAEVLDAFDLMEWGLLQLAPAAQRTQDPDAPANPGGWCRFCKAKGRACEAFERAAFEAATDQFGAIVAPGEIPAKELGERLAKAAILKEWIKAVEEIAENEAKAGRMPDGFKWIASRGSREWKASDVAIAHEVLDSTGVDITDKITLSVAQAEKRVGKKLFERIAHLVEKKPGKPKLAPVSDPKPAIDYVANSTIEFSEIDTYE